MSPHTVKGYLVQIPLVASSNPTGGAIVRHGDLGLCSRTVVVILLLLEAAANLRLKTFPPSPTLSPH